MLLPPPLVRPPPTLTSSPVQAEGTRRCARGRRRFPCRGRVAGRGVGFRAVALRLAVFLVQAQRRQRQLLPGDARRAWVRGERTHPRVLLPGHPPRNGPGRPSPFLPPAVPGVPEALGKRVVVDLQLSDLRGPRGRHQVRMPFFGPGRVTPRSAAAGPHWRARERLLGTRPPGMRSSEPKGEVRPAGGPRRERQGLSSFKVFEAESLTVHTQAQSCEHRGEMCPSMHTGSGALQTRHLRPQRTRRSVDTHTKISHTRRPTHTQVHTEKMSASRMNENTRFHTHPSTSNSARTLDLTLGVTETERRMSEHPGPRHSPNVAHPHRPTGGGALPLWREGAERHPGEKALWLEGKVSKPLPRGLGPGLAPRGVALRGASPVRTSGSSGRVKAGPQVPSAGFLSSGRAWADCLGHPLSI